MNDEGQGGRTEGLTLPGGAPLEPLRIEATDGPGSGASAVLKAGSFTVGSAEGCDLVLADSAVSRRHLSIELMPGSVRLRDLGSRNGTFYLGARVDEARVPVGGTIRVGRTTLRFAPMTQSIPVSTRTELFGLIGSSMPMRQLFATLERLGPQDVPVLLNGETGSGKEAVARAIHQLSPRKDKAFVTFDCGAVSPELIESELFGHAKGSFTGAIAARAGLVEEADGGTLFLDEIGELPLNLQPKLLRVLEAREYRRVGETDVRTANMRIVSATHRNLETHIKEGKFRQDLFYRLAVTTVVVPPLRARVEDIPALAQHFAKQLTGMDVPIAPATMAALQCHNWPGNVRELRNAVQRAVTLGALDDQSKAAAGANDADVAFDVARDQVLERFERDYLKALLQKNRGNVSAVAREAKLTRARLYRMLEKHDLIGDGRGTPTGDEDDVA